MTAERDDGRPDWRTDTAERPRVGPVITPPTPSHRAGREPPHVVEAPPPARFPLYADELGDGSDVQPPDLPTAVEPAAPDWFTRAAEVTESSRSDDVSAVPYLEEERRTPVAWIVVALAVVALVVLGWWYLARAQ